MQVIFRDIKLNVDVDLRKDGAFYRIEEVDDWMSVECVKGNLSVNFVQLFISFSFFVIK